MRKKRCAFHTGSHGNGCDNNRNWKRVPILKTHLKIIIFCCFIIFKYSELGLISPKKESRLIFIQFAKRLIMLLVTVIRGLRICLLNTSEYDQDSLALFTFPKKRRIHKSKGSGTRNAGSIHFFNNNGF